MPRRWGGGVRVEPVIFRVIRVCHGLRPLCSLRSFVAKIPCLLSWPCAASGDHSRSWDAVWGHTAYSGVRGGTFNIQHPTPNGGRGKVWARRSLAPPGRPAPHRHQIQWDRMNKMNRMTANSGGETFYPVNPVHPVKGFGLGRENVWPAGTPCEGTRPVASFEGEHRTFNIQHSTSNIQHPMTGKGTAIPTGALMCDWGGV
jgi:hypothetical protein